MNRANIILKIFCVNVVSSFFVIFSIYAAVVYIVHDANVSIIKYSIVYLTNILYLSYHEIIICMLQSYNLQLIVNQSQFVVAEVGVNRTYFVLFFLTATELISFVKLNNSVVTFFDYLYCFIFLFYEI